jgi:hypothetical protein
MTAEAAATEALKKKTVILVHGLGDIKKNSLLFKVADVIAAWMERHASPRRTVKQPEQLTLDEHLNGDGASSVDLKFQGQHWEFLEVWWADAVEPPAFDPLIGWTFQRATSQLFALIRAMVQQSVLPFILVVLVSLPYIITFTVMIILLAVTWVITFGNVSAIPGFYKFITDWMVGSAGIFSINLLKPRLQMVDESRLVQEMEIKVKEIDPSWRKIVLSTAFLGAILLFHGVNSIVIMCIYVASMALIIPLLLFVWVLAMVADIPKVSDFANYIKVRLDPFLVGSLGSIKVFMDEPTQARIMRRRLEEVLDKVQENSYENGQEIYVIAHSAGAPIAYETLVLNAGESRNTGIIKLITIGSIMSLVRRVKTCRSSLKSPLTGISWINIWTRYDPVLAGPLPPRRSTRRILPRIIVKWRWLIWWVPMNFFKRRPKPQIGLPDKDIPVSNEGDPFNDHSSYWDNEHQVIPSLISEIWSDDAEQIFEVDEGNSLQWMKQRKWSILLISSFRLMFWLLFPLTLWGTLAYFMDWPMPWLLHSLWENYLIQWFDEFRIAGSFITDVLEQRTACVPSMIECESSSVNLTKAIYVSVVAALAVTIVGQLAYKFSRALIWDGFIKDHFSASLPAP